MNEPDSDTFARFARRFADIEAHVKDPPARAAGMRSVPGLRRNVRPLGTAIGVVAFLVALAAFGPLIASQMATGPTAGGPAVGASATAQSQSTAASPAPTPAPTVASAPRVVCGRLDVEPCTTAIGLVRRAHPREVAAAWAIVVDDVCPPSAICDRLYPFDSAVVLVPPPGSSADLQPFDVVGKVYTPERVEAWSGSLPSHIVALIESLRSAATASAQATPSPSPVAGG